MPRVPGRTTDQVDSRSADGKSGRRDAAERPGIASRRQPEPGAAGQAAGNMAVQAALASGGTRISAPGGPEDAAEAEARTVAERISRGGRASCACGGRCAACAGGGRAGRNTVGRGSSSLGQLRRPPFWGLRSGRPLAAAARERLEPRLGADLATVRIHAGASAAVYAGRFRARALAWGENIVFGRGQHRPGSSAGERLLAHELVHVLQQRSGRAQGPQRQAEEVPGQGVDPPVMWGMDVENNHLYLSVLHPGHPLDEVATWLYGTPDAIEELRQENDFLPHFLPAGTTIRPVPGRSLTDEGSQEVSRALSEGSILRTEGIPTANQSTLDLFQVPVEARRLTLTRTQFRSLMRGLAVKLRRKANTVAAHARIGLETQQEHEERTNSVVRGISDWLGDVEPPSRSRWRRTRQQAVRVRNAFGRIGEGNFSEDPLEDASRLQELSQQLREAAEALDQVEYDWKVYLHGTISGAHLATTTLEITRDVSFGIAAGLAGAVAAPAVFAAAGGGGLGTGLALLAGTGAGGVTGTTLETTGAIGGELFHEAITPGEQAFDWEYVEQRAVTGAKSGAIQGVTGAGGALAAPGLGMAVSNRLFGVGPQALTTWGQRALVNTITGSAIGLPSGMGASALEGLGGYIRGDISTEQYLTSIGFGGALGFGGGAVFSHLPIRGLYRTGGRRFNPFSGQAQTPRWMLAGPHSPIQRDWRPPPGFNRLPSDQLPPLPEGYAWVRLNNQWEPMSLQGPLREGFRLQWYGPESGGRANWNLLHQGRLVQSHAFTRPRGQTYQGPRRPPMETADYVETRVDPETGESSTVSWIRGHNVDHADTIEGPNVLSSTTDPANYTPEARDWGLFARNNLVRRIRRAGGGYRQVNFYADQPRFTADGTPIPEGVYFIETDAAGSAVQAWEIPFNNPPRLLSDLPPYRIDLSEFPSVLLRPQPRPSLPTGGAASSVVSPEAEQ